MSITNNGKKYISASIYYVIGNIIGQGVVLLSSGVFTRMMSKEAYGLVNTYSTWVLVLNTFICLNLFITTRNGYIDFQNDYERFKSSILLQSLSSAVVFSAIIIGISFIILPKDKVLGVIVACVHAISLHTVNFQMAADSMENKFRKRTFYLIAPQILHTALSILLVWQWREQQYYGKILGNMAGFLILAIVVVISQFWRSKPTFIRKYWSYALNISVPAIFQTLSDLVLIQCDRLMLTYLINAEATAEYSLVYNIGSIIYVLYVAISGAWISWMYSKIKKEEYESVKKYQKIYLWFFLSLTICITSVSPEVIKILSPSSYWRGMDYIGLIVMGSFLMYIYSFFTSYLMYQKRVKAIMVNTIIAAFLNVFLNYLLIPSMEGLGAALTTVIAYVVLCILHYIPVRKEISQILNIPTMIFSIVVLCLYVCVFPFILNMLYIRYIITFIIISACIIYLLYTWKKGQKI